MTDAMTADLTARKLPADVTAFDVLKSVAVIIMIIDHLGYYFFPDDPMFRAVGRTGFPIWFFLVGYARGRDISPKLIIGGLILCLANFVVGFAIVPLNTLFTILFIRVLLDRVAAFTFKTTETFVLSCALMVALFLPTFLAMEYGTVAFVMAMLGYIVRNRPAIMDMGKWNIYMPEFYAVFAFLCFTVSAQFLFEFPPLELVVMVLGTAVTMWVLLYTDPVTLPVLTRSLPRPVIWLLHLGGRRTLEIYVIHLTIFKIVAAYLFPDHYNWFHFHFFYFTPDPTIKHD